MIEEVAADTLRRRRTRGWLVGGTVRDRRLGRYSPDLDVVVEDDPRQVAADLAAALGRPWFALSIRHGAFRVMTPAGHVDVAALQGATIDDDLARRDFTMNAMAQPLEWPLLEDGLVDPFNGMAHLDAGVLVAVSDTIFASDPLRLMRAARFCHVLGMRLDESLEVLVRSQSGLLDDVAGERVSNEVVLTLDAGRAGDAAVLWAHLGLLPTLFPGGAPTIDPTALEALDRLLTVSERPATGPTADLLRERLRIPVDGSFSRPAALRLAMLARSVAPDEVADIAQRLKLSVAMKSLLSTATDLLVSEDCLEEALVAAGRPGRALISFLWLLAPWEPEALLLAAAELSAREVSVGAEGAVAPAKAALGSLLGTWGERAREGVPAPPLNGDRLMERLDVEPGPTLGRVVREVRLAWESGEASSEDDLMDVARDFLGTMGPGQVSA